MKHVSKIHVVILVYLPNNISIMYNNNNFLHKSEFVTYYIIQKLPVCVTDLICIVVCCAVVADEMISPEVLVEIN